jgi:hypothetical protein
VKRKSADSEFLEICFNIRYPAKNRRSTGNLWSIHQTTVYYQFDYPKRRHVWMVSQLSGDYGEQILRIMNSSLPEAEIFWTIDAAYLISTNWYRCEYIFHLQESARALGRGPAMTLYSEVTVIGKQSPLLESWRPSKERLCCVVHTLATTPAIAKEGPNR